jgi:hypothetical protein
MITYPKIVDPLAKSEYLSGILAPKSTNNAEPVSTTAKIEVRTLLLLAQMIVKRTFAK